MPATYFINTKGKPDKLCVYDWELSKIHIPQHDLVEFLMFALQPGSFTRKDVEYWIDFYREQLETASGINLDCDMWRMGFIACVKEYSLFRFGLYIMIHAVSPFGFVERVFKVSSELLAMFADEKQ